MSNKSSQVINTVAVEVGGKILAAEDIEPGDQHSWRLKPGQDSAFVVSGHFDDGEAFGPTSVGYTTPGDTMNHFLALHDDGTVSYELGEAS